MSVNKTEQTLCLEDGRHLGYAEYGAPQGTPVMVFHGYPGSRLQAQLMSHSAAHLGVRIVAPERPGFGLSDFKPRRTFLDWPRDVLALADALGADHFAVLGISGGGPYAAVCAHQIPQRVTKVGLVAALGPSDVPGAIGAMQPQNRLLLRLGRYAPWLLPILFKSMAHSLRTNPDKFLKQATEQLPEEDLLALQQGDHWAWLLADARETFRSGVRGAAREAVLFARPWGFRLEEIRVPVYLWQGEKDQNAPPVIGQYLARTIPGCQAKFVPDKAHYSLIVGYVEEVLRKLVE
jgi:pimeloyl-ACP methyl ester carboxylesterase